METKEFVYETTFPEKTGDAKAFTEHLWARRKVGYLLDQIRANGEKKELVDEVTALAKKYGITTPYTSWLIVPDGPVPVAQGGRLNFAPMLGGGAAPAGLAPAGPGGKAMPVSEYAKQVQTKPGDVAANRGVLADKELRKAGDAKGEERESLLQAREKKDAYDLARAALKRRDHDGVQAGKLGVDLSIQMNNLRNQSRVEQTALRQVAKRNCVEIGGVWIDEGYEAKMPTVAIKAMSDAYFRILERHPETKEVFQLGNHLLWVTPNGSALVIDTTEGKDKLDDAEIDKLFVAKK
jgi:Ca-activated chloride channel family protein